MEIGNKLFISSLIIRMYILKTDTNYYQHKDSKLLNHLYYIQHDGEVNSISGALP